MKSVGTETDRSRGRARPRAIIAEHSRNVTAGCESLSCSTTHPHRAAPSAHSRKELPIENLLVEASSAATHIRRPLLLAVEGMNDIYFLTGVSKVLAREDPKLPVLTALTAARRLIVIPCGGGSALSWADRLIAFGCPELHIYDQEMEPEASLRRRACSAVNRRANCRAFLTRYRAIENYLHPAAIQEAGGGQVDFSPDDCVGTCLAAAWHQRHGSSVAWIKLPKSLRSKRVQRAKRWLNQVAVNCMTPALLAKSDPEGDLRHWIDVLDAMVPPPL
jgi:putative ATP-dependent endonuclease of OLD family